MYNVSGTLITLVWPDGAEVKQLRVLPGAAIPLSVEEIKGLRKHRGAANLLDCNFATTPDGEPKIKPKADAHVLLPGEDLHLVSGAQVPRARDVVR